MPPFALRVLASRPLEDPRGLSIATCGFRVPFTPRPIQTTATPMLRKFGEVGELVPTKTVRALGAQLAISPAQDPDSQSPSPAHAIEQSCCVRCLKCLGVAVKRPVSPRLPSCVHLSPPIPPGSHPPVSKVPPHASRVAALHPFNVYVEFLPRSVEPVAQIRWNALRRPHRAPPLRAYARRSSTAREPRVEEGENVGDLEPARAVKVGLGVAGEPGVEECEDVGHAQSP